MRLVLIRFALCGSSFLGHNEEQVFARSRSGGNKP
jgi:hypothetical protein